MNQMRQEDQDDEYLGKYEVIFGQHLDSNNPLLSPKLKNVVNDKAEIEKMLSFKNSTSRGHLTGNDMTPAQNTGNMEEKT